MKPVVNIKTPFLTVDGIINIQDDKGNFTGVVLIERKYPPIGLALPGGFVDYGETVEEAVIREMKEETGLDVIILRQFHVYSDPARDPRQHTVSVVFECVARGTPQGQDDAKKAIVVPYKEIPFEKLVFDHKKILIDYLHNKNAIFK
ncbi:NUDIX domain-containing protein [Desulfurobacterium atlanticum]|uniref:8-oxo-dGTP diphosphatase n=1 Tax=Desulfurobacterium atlanticum TaxID=240169 RepID=A0A238YU00_9BACT|nr:NUDIX hydrolase [Desulfurobacterium atlanticum]SNR74625.1 8-oxo-dGTP diphosphatase [Desulfurobacterium atlanticum]